MGDWASYRLGDFLLFSERVYRRLFEAHNEAWWPLPLVMAALAVALGVIARATASSDRAWTRRASLVGLGALWLFVATAFLRLRYAPINPLADAASWAFGAQGLALVAAGTWLGTKPVPRGRAILGGGFVLWGLLYPVQAWWRDGSLDAAQWFGAAPDPTAIATIGVLLLAIRSRAALAALLVVPVLWCLLSALTLRAMDEREMLGSAPAFRMAFLAGAEARP